MFRIKFHRFYAHSQNSENRLLASSCLSVHPHGTIRIPLDGFSRKFIFEDSSKICRENSSFIKIWQEYRVLYMKTYVLWSYLPERWIKRDQLDVTCFIISLFNAQHVSDVNTSILRSFRLICWVIWGVVLLWFDVCWCYAVVWLWWCGSRMQAETLLVSLFSTIKIVHGPINIKYLPECYSESEMFQTEVGEKIKTHFKFNNLSLKSCPLRDNVEK